MDRANGPPISEQEQHGARRAREEITQLLIGFGKGDIEASDRLLDVVYGELRKLARRNRYRWRGADVPGETSLIHDAYLRLVDDSKINWENRRQFFYMASLSMKNILVDNARRRKRIKRGGDQQQVTFDDSLAAKEVDADEILALDQALTRLRAENERLARIVDCRIFGGLTVEETAEALDVSAPTVKRGYSLARSWLYKELQPEGATGDTAAGREPE